MISDIKNDADTAVGLCILALLHKQLWWYLINDVKGVNSLASALEMSFTNSMLICLRVDLLQINERSKNLTTNTDL